MPNNQDDIPFDQRAYYHSAQAYYNRKSTSQTTRSGKSGASAMGFFLIVILGIMVWVGIMKLTSPDPNISNEEFARFTVSEHYERGVNFSTTTPRPEGAIRHLTEVLRIDPDAGTKYDKLLHGYLGQNYYSLGDYDSALLHLTEQIKIQDYMPTWKTRAYTHAYLCNHTEAMKDMRIFETKDVKYNNRGTLEYKMQEVERRMKLNETRFLELCQSTTQ